MNTRTSFGRNSQNRKRNRKCGLFRGHNGITEGGRGHAGADGWAVRGDQKGFREGDEGVKCGLKTVYLIILGK